MPTVLDAFFISVGLKLDDLNKGTKELTDKVEQTRKTVDDQSRHIEESGKRAAEYFHQIRDAAVEFLTVFTAGKGFVEFTRFITETDAGMRRVALAFGISAQDLNQWSYAAEATGGTMAGMESTIEGLITRFQNIGITGDTSLIPFLRALNIQIRTTKDGTLDWQDALLQISDVLSRMPRARAVTFLQDMGITDPGSINLILMGRDALESLLATMRKYAARKEETDAALQRQVAFTKLWAAWQDVGRKLVTAFTPEILMLIKALNMLADFALDHQDLLKSFFLVALAVVTALTVATGLFVGGILGRLVPALGAGTSSIGVITGAVIGAVLWFSKWVAILGLLDSALRALDPGDKLGSWIDKHIPGASWLDNAASKIGFGRSYEQQAIAASADSHESYIREQATKRGLDPDIAVAVAKSEGLGGRFAGDHKSSFGDFQLHVGGIAPGRDSVAGLGDEFRRATGLDPRDPKNWKAMDSFALDYAAKHGWDAFHGAARHGIGTWTGIGHAGLAAAASHGAPSSTTMNTYTTHVDQLIVQATHTNDPGALLRAIRDRLMTASSGNTGLN